MPGNSFGTLFKITTFGESHGKGVGVIVDGVPPGISLTEEDIQKDLDQRRPGQSSITSPRKESDTVHILSGLFEGRTTGTPLTLMIYNSDMKPEAYDNLRNSFRPGHADYTYYKKYGIRDHRGSGRASGRETAARVAAGAVAKKLLSMRGITILAYTKRAAGIECTSFNEEEIKKNPLRAPDSAAAEKMVKKIEEIASKGDSFGGLVECRIKGVPSGLGEPVFDKIDALLAQAMLSIGAVKGIEFGSGFKCVDMKGSENNDPLSSSGFGSNNAGGVLGGITTGQEIIFRIAVKPTSSIEKGQPTVNLFGAEEEIKTTGRHDPCICPRIIPVVEAMTALVLEDLFKLQASLYL